MADQVAVESRHATLDESIKLWCQRHDVEYTVGAGVASRGYGCSLYFFMPADAAAEVEREFADRLALSRATADEARAMLARRARWQI